MTPLFPREGYDAFGRKVNPCLNLYGPGPEGKTCRTCTHGFYSVGKRRHHKCGLRRCTHGAATDHSSRLPACGRYREDNA